MSLKLENEARLESHRASLKRLEAALLQTAPGSPAFALLKCKEEDTRLAIWEMELIYKRYERARD